MSVLTKIVEDDYTVTDSDVEIGTVMFIVHKTNGGINISSNTHFNSDTRWQDGYLALVAIRDELDRQISEAKKCPAHPLNIRK